MTPFLVLMVLVSSAVAAPTSLDVIATTREMKKANYFTFVMLINMAPSTAFFENVTLLMPNDRALSEIALSEASVVDFLLQHSIPSPMLMIISSTSQRALIPTLRPGFMLNVTNDGRRRFFINNVRIISPNICTKGSSIRCHGVDGVVQSATASWHNVPPAVTCTGPPVTTGDPSPLNNGGARTPSAITALPPSIVATSSSPMIGHKVMVDLVITIFMLAYSLN